jgi:lipopolysaccharide/colanic/teichoic acid biosynthesis glycosyltransferase
MQRNIRYVPLVRDLKIRTGIGFILLVLSSAIAVTIIGRGNIEVLVSISAIAWIIAVFLTDKYAHKYPQRYLTYLFASHAKAAAIMATVLWIISGIGGFPSSSEDALWAGFLFFVFSDALASLPRRRDVPERQASPMDLPACAEAITNDKPDDLCKTNAEISPIDTQAIMKNISSGLDKPLFEFIGMNLPDLHGGMGDALILDDVTSMNDRSNSGPVGLLVSRMRLNDVRRLNRFFLSCADRIPMGGYFAGRYVPHENVTMHLKRRHAGFLYWPIFILHFAWRRAFPKIPRLNALYFFLTNGRNRVLSKVEIWGRLSYCGMRVIADSAGDGESYLIAQRVAMPVRNKRPSYYPIVALEKVGLDGETIRTHKIRTMFPFSEFLQKRIFEDHGLAPTGKFANDFRLTEYGKFLRKYWLDELPQVLDWLRGDVKLVGMRATSRHFLSLYPKELYDLYIQIKPGLIPPIFDESTNGLESIAGVELAYLRRYCDQPFRTDVRYLFQTFTDIVFRGVRSK